MKGKLLIIGGFLMAPLSVLGLLGQPWFVLFICPQALVVMFVRQSQRAFDSLGAADYPDLAVAALYYPLIGWILSRAAVRDRLHPVAIRTALWHIAAIGLAVGVNEIRNRLWGIY